VNYNGGDEVVRDLGALRRCAPEAEYEIVLVDNASPDGSGEAAARAIPSIRLIGQEQNRGFAAGVNRGLTEAQGEVIVILNPDAVPREGALDALVEAAATEPDLGVLGGVIVSPAGNVDACSARPFPRLNDILWEGCFLPKRRPPAYHRLVSGGERSPIRVDVISGAAMALRRDALDRVGPMNEEYFLYDEDIEWCERSHRVGLGVAVVPTASFVHRQGSSTRRDETLPFTARMLADFQFFVEHRGVAAPSVRWRWIFRQRFRQLFYRIDAVLGPPQRRERARARTAIYARLARRVARLRWSTTPHGQNAHPGRLEELSGIGPAVR
ncbi:MAG TPA: glycosyltransferase family 2 protein, partial [bacterium]|nr:glycosyltransferase family 2 protein [bacterium]